MTTNSPSARMRRGACLVSLTASSPRMGSCVQQWTAADNSLCLGLDPASHISKYVTRIHTKCTDQSNGCVGVI